MRVIPCFKVLNTSHYSARSFVLALVAFALVFLFGCATKPKPESKAPPGVANLFDGKTLAGWAGVENLWSVEDGAITGRTTPDNPLKNNTFLVWTNGTLDNFELHLEYRILGGNSGIQYRSRVVDPEKFIVGGYQADIDSGKRYSGILYEERGRGILGERGQRTVVREVDGKTKVEVIGTIGDAAALQRFIREGQWNHYYVVANGNHFLHFINDHFMVDVLDEEVGKAAKSGILALQLHAGPPMFVQFRNVQLRPLP
jgi:hypothetical protein